ncbi:hypothetical protein [Nafulsella turpanensis]|uniref:hypothetical protein n=1 Tax=Nafulsella turpanensis TaxID=1265690 RepID=UPI00034B1D25|nr:hypothetical protein [Nafulsella turpanensis]
MRTLPILLFITFLFGCSSNKVVEDSAQQENKSLVEVIKLNAHPRQLHVNLDSVNSLAQIDSITFKAHFHGIEINNVEDLKLEYDPYSRYYYHDYAIKDNLIFFSIIHNDEVGYNNLYHFIFDTTKGKLVSADLLGQAGGDGGHNQIEIFDYSTDGTVLKITTISSLDEDYSLGYTTTVDSINKIYKLGNEGAILVKSTTVTRVDSIRTNN